MSLKWTVEPGLPLWLQIDGQRVAQIISNLLSNAIKFSPNGAVTVTVSRISPDSKSTIASTLSPSSVVNLRGDGGVCDSVGT